MNENEAIERIKYRMHTAGQVTGESGMEDLEMAVQALEEIQCWHTSVVNPNIKNEFANRSTQICVNCDHKDEYIEELEAEVGQYRTLEKRLAEMFGAALSLEGVIDELERQLKEPGNPHPINAKILTYEDAAAWDAYRAIGAPEECRAAMEKQTACDPDKVVEQLEKLKKAEQDRPDDCDEDGCGDGEQIYDDGRSQGRYEAFGKAIQIVKGGGVDG